VAGNKGRERVACRWAERASQWSERKVNMFLFVVATFALLIFIYLHSNICMKKNKKKKSD
jgi:hypothetical protein